MRTLFCLFAAVSLFSPYISAEDKQEDLLTNDEVSVDEVFVEETRFFTNYREGKKVVEEEGKNLILVFYSDTHEPRYDNFSEYDFSKEICCMIGSAEYVIFNKGPEDPNVKEFLEFFTGFIFPIGGPSMTTILINYDGEGDFILESHLLKDIKHHY
ncbi:hypothetical protein [Chlamydia sp. 17-3921]|uniref:hypothetical protein n=1 Tax=Chlamydia sp. 17-3921 TaxID=2675798 RepID=UPI0019198F7C|nr:hypothetical protein [Chlamydia sp. 17-3921]